MTPSTEGAPEPPDKSIGLVCVLPPSVEAPVIGELLAPMVRGRDVEVALPWLDCRRGGPLRWRHVMVPERDAVAVRMTTRSARSDT